MVMHTDYANILRGAGLQVVEVSGWKKRTRPGGMKGRKTGVVHYTATSNSAKGDIPTLRVLINGHGSLSGPLSQLGLSRSGVWYVVAAGRCNHAGATWITRQSNSYAFGVEAEHSGSGPWSPRQYNAYVRGMAALYAAGACQYIEGHKEIAKPKGRKTDPNFSMAQFRADVKAAIAAGKHRGPAGIDRAQKSTGGKYLTVNGELNTGTQLAIQQFLNANDKGRYADIAEDGVLGDASIKKLQWMIGVSRDGDFGYNSARAAEKWLGVRAESVNGWYPGLIRALQRRINWWIKNGRKVA